MNARVLASLLILLLATGCSTIPPDGPYYFEMKAPVEGGNASIPSRILYKERGKMRELVRFSALSYGGGLYHIYGKNLAFDAWNSRTEKHELHVFSERKQKVIVVDDDIGKFWRSTADDTGITFHRPKDGNWIIGLVDDSDPNPQFYPARLLGAL